MKESEQLKKQGLTKFTKNKFNWPICLQENLV
jgi:hypothetical protein